MAWGVVLWGVLFIMFIAPADAFADRVEREAARAERRELAEQLGKIFSGDEPEPAWISQARRGKERGTIETACANVRRFYAKAQAFKTAEQKKIRWTDITTAVRREEAVLQHRKEGRQTAEDLLALAKRPAAEREGIRCAKQLPDLGSSPAIIEAVMDILREAKIDPTKTDFGFGDGGLRGAALDAFLAEVEAARAAGDTPRLKAAARHAAQWDFGPGDLQLTEQEIQAIR